MTEQPLAPTSDESLLAAISHFFGLLVALIVWATQKDKSRYVRFQAVQAMVFDLVVSVIVLLAVGCMIVLIFGVLALGIGDFALIGSQSNPTVEPFRVLISMMTAIPLLIPCIMVPVIGIIFLARLIATIQTFQGKDFHYPWLGRLVEQYHEH
ncbi:MAG: DUF4870 domain-containing protein [Anaerolineales bacterium]